MSKIAFFVQHMLCGGVENSLIALTKKLYAKGHNVTIYVIKKDGGFINSIPDGVKLKAIPMSEKLRDEIPVGGIKLSVRKNLSERHFIKATRLTLRHIFKKTEFAELNVDFNKIPPLDENYDIAVNYHIHSPFLVKYLSEKVTANKKYAWIHNDFSTTGYNIKALKEYLNCYNGFFGVSEKLITEFVGLFPEFENKTQLAKNIVPVDEILKKSREYEAGEYANVADGELKLLTVGRLEHQKGLDMAVQVCKKLYDSGNKFKWFVLGEGSERKNLENEIKKAGLTSVMFLLGNRLNPYPYFKGCDIYVQTSRHEGWGITLTEAMVFHLPIVCTDVAGAREQLVDGVNADIAEISVESIYEKLQPLISDAEKRRKYIVQLEKQDYNLNYSYFNVFE